MQVFPLTNSHTQPDQTSCGNSTARTEELQEQIAFKRINDFRTSPSSRSSALNLGNRALLQRNPEAQRGRCVCASALPL
ncbi:Hypothetical predicted protein [Podarcis lilfordi]|uniref:Uncharacterized protein n=1 Tax=Podarcis lilfordi TaxID=74358 RepID=A0AA35JXD7_9SAUR|nr:Hypothetical predicted protein [Podarcis lilfordi]